MRLYWSSFNSFAKSNKETDFVMVYIREAHASDVWPLGHHVDIPNHKTIEDRKKAAEKLNKDNIEILLDTMDNTFDNTFAAWPERYYIIYDGVIQYIASPTSEFGFDRFLLYNTIYRIYKALRENLMIIRERVDAPQTI